MRKGVKHWIWKKNIDLFQQKNIYINNLIESSDTIKKNIKDKLQVIDDLNIINKDKNTVEDKLQIMDYSDFDIENNKE